MEFPQFASRRRISSVDGVEEDGVWVSDFTLEEIRMLRSLQALPFRDQSLNGIFPILTLEEVIHFVKNHSLTQSLNGYADLFLPVSLYIELKHPTYHRRLGLPLEDKFISNFLFLFLFLFLFFIFYFIFNLIFYFLFLNLFFILQISFKKKDLMWKVLLSLCNALKRKH